MIPDKKICGLCGIEKDKLSFQIRRKPNGYTWLRMECKECQNESRKKKYHGDPEYRKKIIEKNIDYERRNKDQRSEYYKKHRKENIKSITEKAKKRYLKNADRVKEKRKQYYYANKEKVIAAVCDYVERNKEKVRAAQRANHKRRKEADSGYSILKILRSRVGVAIKKKGKRCYRTMDLVGCSMPELLWHLENKFTEGMNWKNYGLRGWHVDHILPCDSFDLTDPEQQKKCFHYTNLQPLWWLDNIKKSNKIAA